ncbi:Hypothetical protein NocV09_02800150 [Nannochloropsis oceanica]
MKFIPTLIALVSAPSVARAASKGLRGNKPGTAAGSEDLSRHLMWTNPTLGAHHGSGDEGASGSGCVVSAEIASPCNMWAFVNGESLDATMGMGNGASHSTLALSGNISSVTLVLKSFCTAFSLPTVMLGGNPAPKPMVGATFDVCGVSVATDDSWVCINHFPEEGSWSSASFDDSAWPSAVTVDAEGLPSGLTFIGGAPETSDGGAGGGWETFCRKTVSLSESTGNESVPVPAVPATPALPSLPPVWITQLTVEGNCSLAHADMHDVSVNFGHLLGLAEEHDVPPVNCTLLGHHSAPALTVPNASACAHVIDPCIFDFSFSGTQDWMTLEMLKKAIHDKTFATIFDTRNSTSIEFCDVREIIADLLPGVGGDEGDSTPSTDVEDGSNTSSESASRPEDGSTGAESGSEDDDDAEDGEDEAEDPAVEDDGSVSLLPGFPSMIECDATVTFELAPQGLGALFQVNGINGPNVTVRATTCVNGTEVDTSLSLFDQDPSDGAYPLASNDNDESCARVPTSSTVSLFMPISIPVFLRVLNLDVEAGGVGLKVKCGVY